ncbi:MAG: hypothetical protein HOB82_05800 [Alphaproteobacteria bacterium]|jgi:hypothetical protein|nr:hypothetical protein [Alphaproteobacteria bacterium]MBT4711022.1 hypothetical protein [Alphaproteobacteria bacterium]MBT5861211.1 hypothetical protein [Alphaproteobacteria bacterium]
MTKAKARKRAKARAAAKLANPVAKKEAPEIKVKGARFDPKSLTDKASGGSVSVNPVGVARRGAARSR